MNSKTIIALALAGSLCLGLCACGEDKPAETSVASQPAEDTATPVITAAAPVAEAGRKNWGNWSVVLPADFELKGRGFQDENDPRYFSVEKSDFSYFDFSADGEAEIMKHYEYNKKTYTNEQKDVSGSFGDHAWVGFQYSDGFGGYGFEAYATIDGEMIRVASVGFRFDSDETKAVLSSLCYVQSDEPAHNTTETPAAEETEAPPTYVKTVKLQDVTVSIMEGYSEVTDGAPSQYVMQNDNTSGKVFLQNMSGDAESTVRRVMEGLECERHEERCNGIQWIVAESSSVWCAAATIGENVVSFTVSFGCTEQEMRRLINSVRLGDAA